MKKLLAISTLSIGMLSAGISPSFATVGGGQTIEVLGYDASEHKVFVLRHFEDARGRLPQLYYYHLSSKNPQKLVAARSIYINPNTKQYDEFDDNDSYFNARLDKIKQRVTKIKPDITPMTIDVKGIHQKKVASWLEGQSFKYQFDYRVLTDNLKFASATTTATCYKVSLLPSDLIYNIPNQPYALTKVSYTGTLMEGSYQFEDVVLLKKTN